MHKFWECCLSVSQRSVHFPQVRTKWQESISFKTDNCTKPDWVDLRTNDTNDYWTQQRCQSDCVAIVGSICASHFWFGGVWPWQCSRHLAFIVQVRARLAEELSNFSEGLKGSFSICEEMVKTHPQTIFVKIHWRKQQVAFCPAFTVLHSKRALYHIHCVCLNVCYSMQVHLLDVLLCFAILKVAHFDFFCQWESRIQDVAWRHESMSPFFLALKVTWPACSSSPFSTRGSEAMSL